jgi:hypothetical protein
MSAGENRRCPLRCCARKRCGDDQWLMVPQLQAAAPPALLGRPAAECRPSKQPSSPSVPPSRRPWPPSPRSSVSSSISRTSATSPSAAPPPTTTASGSWRRRSPTPTSAASAAVGSTTCRRSSASFRRWRWASCPRRCRPCRPRVSGVAGWPSIGVTLHHGVADGRSVCGGEGSGVRGGDAHALPEPPPPSFDRSLPRGVELGSSPVASSESTRRTCLWDGSIDFSVFVRSRRRFCKRTGCGSPAGSSPWTHSTSND